MSWWREKILTPVAVNLITAAAIFLVSLTFTPVRNWVFDRNRYVEYPLFCTAEPYVDETIDTRLHIDFLVTNKSDKDYDPEALMEKLQEIFGPETAWSPLIILKRKSIGGSRIGELVSAEQDEAFNRGKGELVVKLDQSNANVTIEVRSISERTVLRAHILVDGIEGLSRKATDRRTNTQIPFYVKELEDKCFS
jgi:hypothetical protein